MTKYERERSPPSAQNGEEAMAPQWDRGRAWIPVACVSRALQLCVPSLYSGGEELEMVSQNHWLQAKQEVPPADFQKSSLIFLDMLIKAAMKRPLCVYGNNHRLYHFWLERWAQSRGNVCVCNPNFHPTNSSWLNPNASLGSIHVTVQKIM